MDLDLHWVSGWGETGRPPSWYPVRRSLTSLYYTKSFVLSKHRWQSLIFLFNICVLLRLLMLCWNSTAKETWGRRVYLAYASIVLFIIKGTHDRNSNRGDSETWSQKRMHRPWRRSPLRFLIVTCSSCSLIERRTTRTGWHYPRENGSLPINTN